mmetsp:Transcript_52778/g.63536  ORF Transcript_52778/g.63536 Transcript_52778/m.63536 type:complete len:122 (-) Transcript_52778:538-903(-)
MTCLKCSHDTSFGTLSPGLNMMRMIAPTKVTYFCGFSSDERVLVSSAVKLNTILCGDNGQIDLVDDATRLSFRLRDDAAVVVAVVVNAVGDDRPREIVFFATVSSGFTTTTATRKTQPVIF